MLNHPDHIGRVLVKNDCNFTKKKPRYFHRFRQETMLVGDSLLASEGEFWRRQRRLVQPAFHPQRINAYGEVVVSCTERMLATWRDSETRDVYREMTRLGLEIVARALFGVGAGKKIEDVKEALGRIAETFGGGGGGIRLQEGYRGLSSQFLEYLRFRVALRRLDEIVYSIIDERRGSGEDTGDVLSALLHFRDEEGNRMSDKQIRDETTALFFAGHETTAIALSWTWYLLSWHPGAEAKLVAELQRVLGDRAPTADDLPRLHYTEMVIKESMRLFPPVWRISRRAKEDCEIGGYRVPADTRLIMSQWVVHRDPRFFDNPEAFDPDRWEDGFAEQLPRYAYFPFGGGPRVCIGAGFAMMEGVLLLATIGRRFRLAPLPGHRVAPRASITLRPEQGIPMVLHRR